MRRNEDNIAGSCGEGKGGSAPPLPRFNEISFLQPTRLPSGPDSVDVAMHVRVPPRLRLWAALEVERKAVLAECFVEERVAKN
jgi:hypothetical protein